MPDIATLGIKIDANGAVNDLKNLGVELDTTGRKGETAATRLKNEFKSLHSVLGQVAPWVGGGALALTLRKVYESTVEQQRAMAQMEAVLRSTGNAAGFTARQLSATAASLQDMTTYGDEAIISAQSLLLTFTRIRGDVFTQATKAVLDMATAMGGDLKGAAIQLGKALNAPAEGLTALTRVGVTFSDAEQKLIKDMVAAGHEAEAQKRILQELQTEFGGSAEAARNTLGGALRHLSNAWGDLFEVTSTNSAGIIKALDDIAAALPNLKKNLDDAFGSGIDWIKDFELHLNIANQGLLNLSHTLRFAVTHADSERAALEAGIAAIKELRQQDKELENRHAARGLAANDPYSERNEIVAALYGGHRAAAAIAETTKAVDEQKKAVKELDAAYAHNKQTLVDFIAQQLVLIAKTKEADAAARRAQLFGPGTFSGGRSLETGVNDSLRESIADVERWAAELNKSKDPLEKLGRSAQIAGQSLEYYLVSKLGGGGIGSSIGASVAKSSAQDLLGFSAFGSKALGTAIFGPLAAGVGAFVGGLLDGGKAAKQLKEEMERLRESVSRSIDAERARLGFGGDVRQIEAENSVRERYEKLRKDAEASSSVRGRVSGSSDAEREWNRLRDQEIAARKARLAEIDALEKVALQKAKEYVAQQQQFERQDLEVRRLRAQGLDKEAAALALANEQALEYAAAVAQGRDETYLAMLAEVQKAEATKQAADETKRLAEETQRLVDETIRRVKADKELQTNLAARAYSALGDSRTAEDIRFGLQSRQELEKAIEDGMSPSTIAMLRFTQLLERNQIAIQRELEDQTKVIESARDAQTEAIERQIAAERLIAEDQQKAYSQQIDASRDQLSVLNDQLREQERAANETRRVFESLQQFGSGLKLNTGLTTLSPISQLSEARRQYEQLLASANGGDKTAAVGLPDSARAYLEASRAVNASGPGYVSDFRRVQETLATITDRYGAQATVEERILAELQSQSDYLEAQVKALQDAKEAANAASAETISSLEKARDEARMDADRQIAELVRKAAADQKSYAESFGYYSEMNRVLQEQRIASERYFIDSLNQLIRIATNTGPITLLDPLPIAFDKVSEMSNQMGAMINLLQAGFITLAQKSDRVAVAVETNTTITRQGLEAITLS